MSTLYRIQFNNLEFSKPLDDEGIKSLIEEQELDGTQNIQIHPNGEWKVLSAHKLFVKQDATFIRKLSDFGDFKTKKNEKSLSKAETKDEFDPDKTEILQTIGIAEKIEKPIVKKVKIQVDEDAKTKVFKTKPSSSNTISEDDKTLIRPDTVEYIRKMQRQEQIRKREEKIRQKEEEVIDYNNESTQVFKLSDLESEKKQVEEEVEETELELENFQRQKKEKEAKEKAALKKKNNKLKFIVKKPKENKRKKIIYGVAALIFLYVILFPSKEDIEKSKVVVFYPQIQFPIEYEKPNKKKAEKLFRQGAELLNKQTYVHTLKAIELLTKAVEWDLTNINALSKLFLANAMVLDESRKIFKEANTTFKINKIIPGVLYTNIDRVKGMVYFYKNIGKNAAAINVLEKFAKTDNNPSFEIYALWIDLLLDEGFLGEAAKKYEILSTQLNKTKSQDYLSPQLFRSLIHYNNVQSEIERANKWVNRGLGLYPKNVGLILDKIKLYMLNEDTEGMKKYILQVDKLGSANKPEYYAKFLEYSGFYRILNSEPEEAAKLFREALKVKESDNLRSRLAGLKPGGSSKLVDNLISESKSIDNYNKAIELLAQDRWREALTSVTKSVDLDPDYIKAKILFSKLQMRSGFYDQAIKDLRDEIKKYPLVKELYFALLEVYIKLYKFNDAKNIVNIISASEMKSDPKFTSLLGHMYKRMGDKLTSANWFVNSLNKNPLNDGDYYELALLYMKSNRFNEARKFLARAIDLEPFNVEYRAAYARYLYDSKGSDVAIGYLLDLKRDDRFENEKAYLTGEIGIYYYRSGKIENFKDVREQLQAMDYPKKNLYEYVIRTALIDGEHEAIIENSKALLEIETGDIETRMLLGRTYFESERFELALKQFKEVKKMMKAYPRLKYYIAKAHLSIGNRDKAYEIAKEEIAANPHLEDGYILTADISVLKNEWLEAERNYRKALQIKGDSFEAVLGLAYINFKKNKQDSALTLYKKAQQLNPSNAEVYRMLGEIYRLLGQGQKAIDNYRIYLKRAPHSKYKLGIQSYIDVMR